MVYGAESVKPTAPEPITLAQSSSIEASNNQKPNSIWYTALSYQPPAPQSTKIDNITYNHPKIEPLLLPDNRPLDILRPTYKQNRHFLYSTVVLINQLTKFVCFTSKKIKHASVVK